MVLHYNRIVTLDTVTHKNNKSNKDRRNYPPPIRLHAPNKKKQTLSNHSIQQN